MTDTKESSPELLTIRVGRFLQKEYPNIVLASSTGIYLPKLTTQDAIGLLVADSAPQLSRWQKIFRRRPRRRFIGVLRVFNKTGNTTHNIWTLEAYGDQDYEFLVEVAKTLSREFDVFVQPILCSDEPHEEAFAFGRYH